MASPLLFLSAGDPSGDTASARVLAQLKATHPNLRCIGLGGPKLKAHGQEQLVSGEALAVLGFWEVAKRFWFFRELLQRAVRAIETERPSVVVLVDYPGFNLRLAKRIKKFGIPIIYYISPQLWAWNKKRLALMEDLIDLLIIILPFEREFYAASRVKHEFVGHYLLEDIPQAYIGSPLSNAGKLALLPGSRPQEVERMLGPMLEAARLLRARHSLEATVAAMNNGFPYEQVLQRHGSGDVQLVYNDARRIVYESDFVITASGTATLETGIIARPMVIVYRTGEITWQIARRVVDLPMIGLVNLVAGEKVVPELLQRDVTGERMAAEIGSMMRDQARTEKIHRQLCLIPDALGGVGGSARAAALIEKFLC